MKKYLFFDNASTTKCCDEAVQLVCRYANEDFGNPSSSHAFGQAAARAIREARIFFAESFRVTPEQVIFTGSGSESDNLAIYGVAMSALAKNTGKSNPIRVISSSIEHPAVLRTVQSLSAFGIDTQFAQVDSQGQIDGAAFEALVTPETALVSIQQVNNIVGSVLPVEDLAKRAKARNPRLVFHTDAIQAFGRVPVPTAPSSVDLVSISGHKIEGPKGIGALIVLNKDLLKGGLRPLVWGGGQENGMRSGTQSAGLIAGFAAAAKRAIEKREASHEAVAKLRKRFITRLRDKKLIDAESSPLRLNSPAAGVPHIVNLSVPGYPSGPLAKLLEERCCLVSTGSACSSAKADPDSVLTAMGMPDSFCQSAIRVSFSSENQIEEIDTLVNALEESIALMGRLLGGRK